MALDVISRLPDDLIPPPVTVTPADDASPAVESPPCHVDVAVLEVLMVEVASIPATFKLPEMTALLFTDKSFPGVVVPRPRFPLTIFNIV